MFRVLAIPGLVLVDPVIIAPSFPLDEATQQGVTDALGWRSVWSNQQAIYSVVIFSHVLCSREEALPVEQISALWDVGFGCAQELR